MELPLKSIAVTIVILTVLTWAWRVLNWVWLRPKKLEKFLRQQGLKGNSYRLLFGDLKENSIELKEAKARPLSLDDNIAIRVNPFLHKLVNDYGKNSFMWFGPTPRVNIMNPDQIKAIFTKINDFQKVNSIPLARLLIVGLASLEGEKWAKHRKLINPAFHQEKLKLMLPAFYLSCTEIITKWEKQMSVEGSSELDVWPYLANLTSDVISRTAFGSSYEEGRRIFQLQAELAELTMQVFRSVHIPGWREKAMRAGEAANDDLLGILMETSFREIEEHGNNKNVGFSMNDVIEECKLFYLAGQETTSVLLNWTMVLLSKHQDWQERARQEVLQVFGNNKPDYGELNHLKIVQMILYEVLRLYPPLTALSRAVLKETKLGNLTLPAGVQIGLPMILVHQDPELWGDDAVEFKPERFAEGISKAAKNQVSYFPFASGPRICVGQNFALVEAKMATAMILQNYSFELSPSYVHAPTAVPTLHPELGTQLILRKLWCKNN
ncbi:cytochrome P450 72A15 [Citrus sinensis]|uniref:Cytochrome P450 72A15 n=1 Tax=Citrus sinensis TaxID=2711 RepID=A0ACB8M1V3_CITSI|nr:cytochrome P450 72A15 [Citrus sinensis]